MGNSKWVIDLFNGLTSSPAIIALVLGLFILIFNLRYVIKEHSYIKVWHCIKDIICKQKDALLFPLLLIISSIILLLLIPESDYALVDYPKVIPFIMGLAVTLALGTLLRYILDEIVNQYIKFEEKWNKLTHMPEAGAIIGLFERTLYFVAFYFEQPLLIGGILTFKVAAKWEAWKNIVQVPQKDFIGFKGGSYRYFIFRRKLGANLLSRFTVGTFSNILIALVGYGFYRWFLIVLDP
jgi:hypothetical protein